MRTSKISSIGLWVAAACILNYIEGLFPVLPMVPGARIGFANIAILFMLYYYGWQEAILVAVVRILCSGLLFGNLFGILYSLAGSAVSLPIMILTKRSNAFSIFGVSVAGSVGFQMGQLFAAMLLLETPALLYYLSPLMLAGLFAGILTALGARILLSRLYVMKRKES